MSISDVGPWSGKRSEMKLRMSHQFWQRAFAACVSAALLSTAAFAEEKDAKKDAKAAKKVETVEVTVDDLKLSIPKTWKTVKPSSSMRKGQFSIPAAKGEKDAVDYVIFQFGGGGGGIGANVRRWINQFEAKGRKAKITKGKCPQGFYILVDITGTYNMSVGPPIQRKTKKVDNARMVSVILAVEAKKKVYYIKTAGGAKTVDANVDAIRGTFGGDASKEEELKPPGE